MGGLPIVVTYFRKREANFQQCKSGYKILTRLVVTVMLKYYRKGVAIKNIYCKTVPSAVFSPR